MMKILVFLVALCAVFAQSIPADDNAQRLMAYGRPSGPFYMPEPICSYKCPLKCYKMGWSGGYCENSMCMCNRMGGYAGYYGGGGFGYPY